MTSLLILQEKCLFWFLFVIYLSDGKIQRFVHQSYLIVNKYFQNGEKYSEIATCRQLTLNRYSVNVVVKRFNLRGNTENIINNALGGRENLTLASR